MYTGVEGSCAPAGADGSYGTSIERYKALDPASDIILAFKQNGRLLTPDHGYPLRIIIPGSPWLHCVQMPPLARVLFHGVAHISSTSNRKPCEALQARQHLL